MVRDISGARFIQSVTPGASAMALPAIIVSANSTAMTAAAPVGMRNFSSMATTGVRISANTTAITVGTMIACAAHSAAKHVAMAMMIKGPLALFEFAGGGSAAFTSLFDLALSLMRFTAAK